MNVVHVAVNDEHNISGEIGQLINGLLLLISYVDLFPPKCGQLAYVNVTMEDELKSCQTGVDGGGHFNCASKSKSARAQPQLSTARH